MKIATREWVDKAEADWAATLLLRRSRKRISRDIVCFHLQQCVEKYLKTRLEESSLPFPKTHDLKKLLDIVIVVEPLWAAFCPAVVAITNYAVEVRYPGRTTTSAEARVLVRDSAQIRSLVRQRFGLPVN